MTKYELTIRYVDGTDVYVEDWGDCPELLRLLAEAGVLKVEREGSLVRYVSPWKEAK